MYIGISDTPDGVQFNAAYTPPAEEDPFSLFPGSDTGDEEGEKTEDGELPEAENFPNGTDLPEGESGQQSPDTFLSP